MAQLWGGRFTKETDKLVYNFNASISFDQKFYKQDICGSKAHVAMLAKQGILTEEEKDQITEGHIRVRGYPQFRGGKPDRPYRRRRKETPHRKKP